MFCGKLIFWPCRFCDSMTHVPMGILSMELNIVLLKIFHITLIWNYFSLPIICKFYLLCFLSHSLYIFLIHIEPWMNDLIPLLSWRRNILASIWSTYCCGFPLSFWWLFCFIVCVGVFWLHVCMWTTHTPCPLTGQRRWRIPRNSRNLQSWAARWMLWIKPGRAACLNHLSTSPASSLLLWLSQTRFPNQVSFAALLCYSPLKYFHALFHWLLVWGDGIHIFFKFYKCL